MERRVQQGSHARDKVVYDVDTMLNLGQKMCNY